MHVHRARLTALTALRLETASAFEDGAQFVPQLITALSMPVKTVTVRRPSLDDVFLKLTGRAIREADHHHGAVAHEQGVHGGIGQEPSRPGVIGRDHDQLASSGPSGGEFKNG